MLGFSAVHLYSPYTSLFCPVFSYISLLSLLWTLITLLFIFTSFPSTFFPLTQRWIVICFACNPRMQHSLFLSTKLDACFIRTSAIILIVVSDSSPSHFSLRPLIFLLYWLVLSSSITALCSPSLRLEVWLYIVIIWPLVNTFFPLLFQNIFIYSSIFFSV